jgi:hypothetical protein
MTPPPRCQCAQCSRQGRGGPQRRSPARSHDPPRPRPVHPLRRSEARQYLLPRTTASRPGGAVAPRSSLTACKDLRLLRRRRQLRSARRATRRASIRQSFAKAGSCGSAVVRLSGRTSDRHRVRRTRYRRCRSNRSSRPAAHRRARGSDP